ncbi:mitogen-activated protein kinase kinase kinase 20-like [Rhodamnia argentea]|uniref:Mitogen-activated protein kinase kinase kinase 20-like n=1 Tax=Rhodamnia argentea TaxID=178133 RepID=A0A8B8R041_9MYRT|nr:mitogen-activated protein kinase kinase kinase 20-like [Rhodamnia argentea]
MDWVRGKEIGHGGFSTVHLATPAKTCPSDHPPLMAVKSCDSALSSSLRHERRVLSELGECPRIVRCLGDSLTAERGGEELYNVLLEYAGGGSLADSLKSRGKPLSEPEIRRHTRSILEGLEFVHSKGFVHCDVKLQNILVFPRGGDEEVKIADFGLAKRAGERLAEGGKQGGFEWRGTPMYMAPESVNGNEYEPPSDVWALGCAVVEMATGRPAWGSRAESNAYALMIRIGVGDEIPEIPEGLSEQGKDFLIKCFAKNPKKRWTARMLLKHPFLAVDGALSVEEVARDCGAEFTDPSPRCHFDFQHWVSTQCSRTSWESGSLSPSSETDSDPSFIAEHAASEISSDSSSGIDRIGELASHERPNWEHSEGWATVR